MRTRGSLTRKVAVDAFVTKHSQLRCAEDVDSAPPGAWARHLNIAGRRPSGPGAEWNDKDRKALRISASVKFRVWVESLEVVFAGEF